MAFSVRNAQFNDKEKLIILYKDLYPQEKFKSEQYYIDKAWSEICSDNKIKCFVVDSIEHIIGTCILIIVPNIAREAKPYAFIENVVVRKDYQRKGIGSKLIKHALEIAKKNQCYKVMLLTASHNQVAHRFYEKNGFSHNTKTGFEHKFG